MLVPHLAMGVSARPRRSRAPARFLTLALTAMLVLSAAAGCGRVRQNANAGSADILISVACDPNPPVLGPGTLIVSLSDAAGRPVDGASVRLEGNMSHAGMVPVFAGTGPGEDGRYRAPMNWTMGGDWTVDVKVTLPDGHSAAQRFSFTVGGGG